MDFADVLALIGFFLLSGGVYWQCGAGVTVILVGALLLAAGLMLGFARAARKNGDSR